MVATESAPETEKSEMEFVNAIFWEVFEVHCATYQGEMTTAAFNSLSDMSQMSWLRRRLYGSWRV